MLLPDMFDEKVALMGKEAEFSESRTTEKGTLIALSSGQMVTLFTTGPEGRATVAPMGVILDDAKGTAAGKHYQSARIILHATGNSDYRRPQLTDRSPERNAAGGAPTRALSSLISDAIRRRPWTLGIASAQAPSLPQFASRTPSMATTPLRTEPHLRDAEGEPAEGGVDVDCENENENGRTENAPAVGWFGGMTRWASKLWTQKRAKRLSTPPIQE